MSCKLAKKYSYTKNFYTTTYLLAFPIFNQRKRKGLWIFGQNCGISAIVAYYVVNQDYGNWSFSLLTRDFDLWDDERHSQKALITGEMASFEIYFMAH